jgi:hypothetical protein
MNVKLLISFVIFLFGMAFLFATFSALLNLQSVPDPNTDELLLKWVGGSILIWTGLIIGFAVILDAMLKPPKKK